MMRAVLVSLLLVGCADQAPAWIMYAHASYLYGRIEAKAEDACRVPVPARFAPACQEAVATQKYVQTVTPQIEAELQKPKPDWTRILQYLDVVLQLAGKFL